jgi:hypothetical protein
MVSSNSSRKDCYFRWHGRRDAVAQAADAKLKIVRLVGRLMRIWLRAYFTARESKWDRWDSWCIYETVNWKLPWFFGSPVGWICSDDRSLDSLMGSLLMRLRFLFLETRSDARKFLRSRYLNQPILGMRVHQSERQSSERDEEIIIYDKYSLRLLCEFHGLGIINWLHTSRLLQLSGHCEWSIR